MCNTPHITHLILECFGLWVASSFVMRNNHGLRYAYQVLLFVGLIELSDIDAAVGACELFDAQLHPFDYLGISDLS